VIVASGATAAHLAAQKDSKYRDLDADFAEFEQGLKAGDNARIGQGFDRTQADCKPFLTSPPPT
jgi:hypothetical protein